MRPTILVAAFTHHPRLAWVQAPVTTLMRTVGIAALAWLDRRRTRLDERE